MVGETGELDANFQGYLFEEQKASEKLAKAQWNIADIMSAYEEELISEHRNQNQPLDEGIESTPVPEDYEHQFSFKEGSSSSASDEATSLKKHQESHRHVIALMNGLEDHGENNSEEEK